MEKALNFSHFPVTLISWVQTLYNKASSCVLVNGQYSNWFRLGRGCRQGDPISPYLYLICAQIMSLMLRNNNNVDGISIKGKEILLSLFADDTTMFLAGKEKSLEGAIRITDTFSANTWIKNQQ